MTRMRVTALRKGGGGTKAFFSLFDRKTHSAVVIIFERISIWRIYHPFGIVLSLKQNKKKKGPENY